MLKHSQLRPIFLVYLLLMVSLAGCFQDNLDAEQPNVVAQLVPSSTWTDTPLMTQTDLPSATPTETPTATITEAAVLQVTPSATIMVFVAQSVLDQPIAEFETPTPTITPSPTVTPTATAEVIEVAQADSFALTATMFVFEITQTASFSASATARALGIGIPTDFPTSTPTSTPTTSFIAPNNTQLITNTPPPVFLTGATCVHEVRRGETLWSLSRRYGLKVMDIANASGITNINQLAVGQRLNIPNCGTTGITPPPTSTPTGQFGTGGPTTPTTACRTHTVAEDQTLYQISALYGVSMSSIANLNGISNYNYIKLGDILDIPC